MATVSVAAILRAAHFSPNSVASDAAIMNAVAAEVRRRGLTVNVYSEEQFIESGIGREPIVMAMVRDARSLERLAALEAEGRLVLNSAQAIAQCARRPMTRLFERAAIPMPPTVVVETNKDVRRQLEAMGMGLCWVKRADCQTVHKEDVARARHIQEAQEILSEFFIRKIPTAIVAAHVPGLHVKFYGVSDIFFHYYFSSGLPAPASFSPDDLRQVCQRAASAVDIVVYGGDAVVDPETGDFVIVCFNDWPGFAPCRPQAAKAICKFVATHARKLLRK